MKEKHATQRHSLTGFLAVAILSTLFAACTGWDQPEISGVLELSGPISFHHERNGRKVSLSSGPATLNFQQGVFGAARPMVIVTDALGNQVKLSLPRRSFRGVDMNITASELGQPFGIQSHLDQTILSRSTANTSEGCSYCGFCLALQADGSMGFGNSCSCSGTQTVTREIRQISEVLEVNIIRPNGEAAGRFRSAQPRQFEDRSTILGSGTCG